MFGGTISPPGASKLGTVGPPLPGQNVFVNNVQQYWEITLAWIEQRSGVWLPKRQSQRKQLFLDQPQRGLLFRTAFQQRNLAVELYQPEVFNDASSPIRAQWLLTSPQDEPLLMLQQLERGGALTQIDDIRYIAALTSGANRVGNKPPKHGDPVNGDDRSNNIALHFNAYGGDNVGKTGVLQMVKLDNQGGAKYQPMLTQVSQPRVISARFGEQLQFQGPFFISDPQRTFFGLNGAWTLQPFYHPVRGDIRPTAQFGRDCRALRSDLADQPRRRARYGPVRLRRDIRAGWRQRGHAALPGGDDRLLALRALRRLQLGALPPRPAIDRQAARRQSAVRGCARVVSLHL